MPQFPEILPETGRLEAPQIDGDRVADWLVEFLRDELTRRRGMTKVVYGLSGGVDSAVVAYLAARAFGPENCLAVRMPYKLSSQASLDDAQLVIDDLGLNARTIEITGMVDGYVTTAEPDMSPGRLGNVAARSRMIVLFDLAQRLGGLPLGTGNKTERFFGYFTWHADDSPPLNPLGDLYKTQVWELARALGVPARIVEKPATADLVKGQTDEGDFGISYPKADAILHFLVQGYDRDALIEKGFAPGDVDVVLRRVNGTHWKRKLPTVAVLSSTAIGEGYLRPVDY